MAGSTACKKRWQRAAPPAPSIFLSFRYPVFLPRSTAGHSSRRVLPYRMGLEEEKRQRQVALAYPLVNPLPSPCKRWT